MAVCRELTKRFEEVERGTLADIAAAHAGATGRGEYVLVVDRAHGAPADEATLEDALRAALKDRSVKEAAAEVAQRLGLPRRQVYQAALKLSEGET